MKLRSLIYIITLAISFAGLTSCNKYLDVKSNSRLVIPKTAEDLQSLLDNYAKLNANGIASLEISADDYFLTETEYGSIGDDQKRIYTWEKNNLFPNADNDWTFAYNNIYVANVVLDNTEMLYKSGYNQTLVNDIKGQALFIRAYELFQLAATFSLGYNSQTADKTLGVPLRLTSDLNEKIFRPNLQETFDQIIKDLKEASSLLNNIPVHVLRPSKPAAFGLLARVYLYMGKYEECNQYADASLKLKSTLISYNTPAIVNLDAKFPFSVILFNNPEILFSHKMALPKVIHNTVAKVDSVLINSYHPDDNRKRVLFNIVAGTTRYAFKGSYDGSATLFDGVAVDEVYLMRAESYARLNKVPEAMSDLNALLKTRWNSAASYTNLTANNSTEALTVILAERRKSLIMRGLRWLDIKRLNEQGANITVKRKLNGVEYTLTPNDLRYAIAIPESIINFSGMQQNLR